MTIRSSKIRIVLAFMALFLIQFAILSPVSADLTEVETNKQGLSKTEPTDASGGEPVDSEDGSLPWWKKALNELGDFGDSLIDGWNKFKDWTVDEWNDAWDIAQDKWNDAWDLAQDVWGNIEDFFKSIGDWFSENEWAQTLLGGILAAGIIIGVIALLVFFGVIAIPLGIVAGLIIVAGALIGGFTYQWLAGDNYSFWGAFSFALVGGVLGYIGYATGAFAAAIGWIRTVAWPAAANWWRTAAWPWLKGRPAAIWGWMKGPAWNWLKGRGLALKGWFTGRAIPWVKGLGRTGWANFLNFYRTNGFWKGIRFGPILGGAGAIMTNLINFWLTGELDFKKMSIDIGFGVLSGGVIGPAFAAANMGWKVILGLSLYSGFEGYIADGIKEGAWGSFENFFLNFGMSLASLKIIGFVLEKILPKEPAELLTKSIEESIKVKVKEYFKEDVINHQEREQQLEPKQVPEKVPEINQQNTNYTIEQETNLENQNDKVNGDIKVEGPDLNHQSEENKPINRLNIEPKFN